MIGAGLATSEEAIFDLDFHAVMHWGQDPAVEILGELDVRGVRFLTLRMRSPGLTRQIASLPAAAYTTVTLDRTGRYTKPKVHESTGVKLTNYPATVRQFIVTGLGRDAPTKQLIERYARCMTIEQRLAEIIRAFHLDALSSAVNLNVDLDVVLCVLAQAVCAALRARLGTSYQHATPDVLQRRFLDTPGQIINHGDAVTVRINRRAYSPVLRHADLPADTTVPWWNDRRLHFEFT